MTPSRRILFVAPSAYPLGGVQTWLDYLLQGLSSEGWEPLLGLAAGDWHDVPAYVRAHPGLHTVALENPTGSREGRIRAIQRAIAELAPAMAVGVNIPDTYAAVARARLVDRNAPRVVMTIHGIQPDLYEDALRYRDVLDGVVGTNRLAVRLAVEQGIDSHRLHYAPYGVQLAGEVSRRGAGTDAALSIAFVGRLEQWQKRIGDLRGIVQALEGRRIDFTLLIAGAGPDEATLRDQLAEQSIMGRVRLLGSLSESELVDQVYSKADILLLTSSWETGPIVVWEAMAHGLAVVTSRYVGSGLEYGLHDDRNCLQFDVGDADQAATALSRLADPALRQRLVRGGYELVRSRYTRARSIESWDRCLSAILAAPPLAEVADRFPVAPAGRLDRLLGTALGETFRRRVGSQYCHSDPGGEWPHSYGTRASDDPEFWKLARELDTRGVGS